jgi:PAS domain S-box-containing protein
MKVSVENKIMAGFVTTALVLIVLGWLSYHATKDFVSAQSEVAHSHETISQLEMSLAILTQVGKEQGGYLLTGNPKYLKSFQAAVVQVPGQLQKLQRVTPNDPAQREALKQLSDLTLTDISLFEDRVAEFQKSGLQAALAKVPFEKTEATMEDIRTLTAQMRATQEKLLAQKTEHARAIGRMTEAEVITGSVLAVIIGSLAVILVRRDLRLRTLAETKLYQTEDRYRTMIEAVKDYAIYLLDPDGRITSWNEGAQRIKGYKSEEVIGKPFSMFYTKEDVAAGRPQRSLVEAVEKGHFEDSGWHVRKDGSRFWANDVVTAVRDVDGKLLGFVKVTRDLSERKRAGEIQAERDRYFDLSREMICVAGFDGFLKTINPAWKWTLGFSEEELLSCAAIEFVHPDDREATMAEFENLTKGGEIIYFENRFHCKDNSWRWFAWSASAVVPQGMIYATGRDITEQKLSQEKIEGLNTELQHHADQLETANKELESFSYSVSHDLRAPLRHIDGFVKLLLKQCESKLDDKSRRYLDIIADSARRMGVLIDDLLVFSRMSRAEMHHTKVSNESLVHEAVDVLQTEISDRHINWNIESLPEVDADPAMLQQVWVNLISNAVKYTRPRPEAEIKIGSNDSGNGDYIFFVQDNGVGFDMQYANKLFGVFQRLHRAEEFEGTGIGLANVSRIVHRHGGRVWAEGKPDAGATFYFSLPKKPTETKD